MVKREAKNFSEFKQEVAGTKISNGIEFTFSAIRFGEIEITDKDKISKTVDTVRFFTPDGLENLDDEQSLYTMASVLVKQAYDMVARIDKTDGVERVDDKTVILPYDITVKVTEQGKYPYRYLLFE